jgi:GT2 family glycosyltransferase
MKPKLSIVILAWNNQSDVAQCVESILTHYNGYFQLIVVDNGSQDNTPEYLEQLQDNWQETNGLLTIITNQDNLGYAAGNNSALAHIQGEYTLWLNQDIIITPNSIQTLLSYLETHSDYAMIAPQLRYPNGDIQLSCRQLPTLQSMTQSILRRKWQDNFDHTQSQICEQPMASAIMIRTYIMRELGGFDIHPDYWLFFNDVDLSKSLQTKSYKTYFLAEAVMYHHHGASTKKLLNYKKRLYWYRGFTRYFIKWYYPRGLLYIGVHLYSAVLTILLILRDIGKK